MTEPSLRTGRWRPTDPLVWIDDLYDRAYASDGGSRFGAYLRDRAHLVVPSDGEPVDVVEYAAGVWRIATQPVMSPGYVRYGSCVDAVVCRGGVDFDGLVAEVQLRLDWPAHLGGAEALRGWRGWDEPAQYGQGSRRLVYPPDDQPTVLMAARLDVPVPETALPDHGVGSPGVDVGVAKQIVGVVCERINILAAPVAALLQRNGGGAR